MKSKHILTLIMALLLFLCGCSISRLIPEERSTGKTHTASAPQTQANSFFSLTVNEAKLLGTVDGYLPEDEENGAFLWVEVTIEAAMDTDDPIPMYSTDWELTWMGCPEPQVAYSKFTDRQLEDEWDMAQGEQVTGVLLFEVSAHVLEYSLTYSEVWSDGFEGDSYIMDFTADVNEYNKAKAPEDLGRVGGHVIDVQGTLMETVFFDMELLGTQVSPTVEGYTTGIEGMDFLSVELSFTNTFPETITMYLTDFYIQWGDGEEQWDEGFAKSFTDQFSDEWELSPGKTGTGKLYFAVPQGQNRVKLVYTEIWADGFVGDTYVLTLNHLTAKSV